VTRQRPPTELPAPHRCTLRRGSTTGSNCGFRRVKRAMCSSGRWRTRRCRSSMAVCNCGGRAGRRLSYSRPWRPWQSSCWSWVAARQLGRVSWGASDQSLHRFPRRPVFRLVPVRGAAGRAARRLDLLREPCTL